MNLFNATMIRACSVFAVAFTAPACHRNVIGEKVADVFPVLITVVTSDGRPVEGVCVQIESSGLVDGYQEPVELLPLQILVQQGVMTNPGGDALLYVRLPGGRSTDVSLVGPPKGAETVFYTSGPIVTILASNERLLRKRLDELLPEMITDPDAVLLVRCTLPQTWEELVR